MKKLFIIIIGFAININAMEREQPIESTIEVAQPCRLSTPEELGLKYQHEKDKLEKYIANPESLLQKAQTKVGKENILEYLKTLQKWASCVLGQHIVIQLRASSILHLCYYYDYLSKKIHPEFVRLNILQDDKGKFTSFKIFSDEALSEFLSHSNWFLSENTILNDQDLYSTVFPWILSENEEIHSLGLIAKFFRESADNNKLLNKALADSEPTKSIFSECMSDSLSSLLNQVGDLESKLTQQFKKARSMAYLKTRAIMTDYIHETKKIIDIYHWIVPLYEKLYEIIRREIAKTINEQIKANPLEAKKLLEYMSTLPAEANKLGTIPKSLPPVLPPFKSAYQTEKLPSLDKEFEQFKIEYLQKKEATKKITIKKIRSIKPKQKKKEKITKEVGEEKAIEEKQIIPTPKIIKQTPDGSYILEGEETNTRIIVHNPRNNTINVIFKTDKPKAFSEKIIPNYTSWVKQWLENPDQALIDQGYTTKGPKLTDPNLYWKPKALHGFSSLVDDFIQDWALKTEIQSRRNTKQKDILITLPGMIIYPDGTQDFGIYSYLVDSKTGLWYHRMFEPESTQKIVKDLLEKGYFSPSMKGYYDVAFPELKKS